MQDGAAPQLTLADLIIQKIKEKDADVTSGRFCLWIFATDLIISWYIKFVD